MKGSPSTGSERNGAVAADARVDTESALATTRATTASARMPIPTRRSLGGDQERPWSPQSPSDYLSAPRRRESDRECERVGSDPGGIHPRPLASGEQLGSLGDAIRAGR